jgi:hypothetical protein
VSGRGHNGGSMPVKLIPLRYAGTCSACTLVLPVGTKAWWDTESRTITCIGCQASDSGDTVQVGRPEPGPSKLAAESLTAPATGQAGASALREFERRHQRREQHIDQRWGRLAGVVRFLSDDPQSTKAWAKGSEGEQRLAAHLLQAVGDRAVLLNDRKVPGTRGNIDHLVIAASGVWVIDAKNYSGMVVQKNVGRWLKTDLRLYVGRHDRTKAAERLGWQVRAVQQALGGEDVPVKAALCFIAAEWKLFGKSFQQNGVWVTWAKELAEMISEPGPLTPADVIELSERLATGLPPAVTGPPNNDRA